MKQKIYVVGIVPGAPEMMTPQARQALEESDVIVGYPVYLKLLGDLVQNKKTIATPKTKANKFVIFNNPIIYLHKIHIAKSNMAYFR